MKIRALCIDEEDKPQQIPQEKWVIENEVYQITYIFIMANQGFIRGCEIAEHDISNHAPYNCYRLSRFAIFEEDMHLFKELVKQCDLMNQISTEQLNDFIKNIDTIKS